MPPVYKKRSSEPASEPSAKPEERLPTTYKSPLERSVAEDVLTSLLRARSIVWYDPQTGEYVYRALGCAFHFPK